MLNEATGGLWPLTQRKLKPAPPDIGPQVNTIPAVQARHSEDRLNLVAQVSTCAVLMQVGRPELISGRPNKVKGNYSDLRIKLRKGGPGNLSGRTGDRQFVKAFYRYDA
jgi:hypothetical protein